MKFISMIIFLILLTACLPSTEQIQAAIELTQEANPTNTSTNTTSPTGTSTFTNTPEPTKTPEPSRTPTPTKTVKPTNTRAPSATQVEGVIVGYTSADLRVNLEKLDFDCEVVYAPTSSDPYYKWECRKQGLLNSMKVEMWSKSIQSLDLIRASIIQFGTPNDSTAIDFLGYISTIPYKGSKPEEARRWIEETLPTIVNEGDIREITIGGVRLQIYGIPSARSLKIGEDL